MSGKRVLLIEDYEDTAQVVGLALRCGGHAVEIARTGAEGLRMIRALRPDVVICDLGLPDLDGLVVARLIRHDAQVGDVWLIALTAYDVPAEAFAAGFDEYFTKPADITKLAVHLHGQPPRRAVGG
jgi:two-component system, chemotaxis family, CheB/CheR fusion protein